MLNPTLQGNCFFQLLKRIELEKDYTHLNKLNVLCLWHMLPESYKLTLRLMKVRKSVKAAKLLEGSTSKVVVETLTYLKLVELVEDRVVLTPLGVEVAAQCEVVLSTQLTWFAEDTRSNVGTEGYDEN